ncbi:ABC transporter substrate-binding protein [Geomicrobium sediminis]|uniref:Iron complex transport system substrate-binding protein n=1 Tax=Geomicrobium sediminis TaxID=1347788 RepID=A0ABS2PBM0_9BACL|nr:ABC transporter substrate-binding protein [Geomicrobium sediminis]MBM7632741.1 iron complex transport system substrate-binding protein [Geomicrobium sediminis]
MKKIYPYTLAIATTAMLLTACGDQEDTDNNSANEEADETVEETDDADDSESDAGGSEKTVTDGYGNELTVPASPERIIAPYLEDPLLTIGLEPIVQWSVNNGASVQDYLADELGDLPYIDYQLPLESVMEADPDFIVVPDEGTLGSGDYNQYSQMAPTYVMDSETSADWRATLLEMGSLFDRDEEAETALEEYDAYVEEVKQELNDTVGDDKVAVVWLINGSYFVVAPNIASGAVLFEDLELEPANAIAELPEDPDHWNELSLEAFANLDAEYLFLVNGDGDSVDSLMTEDVWSTIPAVENDQVIEIADDSSWLYNGYQANRQTIEEVHEQMISE